jgi:hypothetical protein
LGPETLQDALVWISQRLEIGVKNLLGINFVTRPACVVNGNVRLMTFSAREKNTTRAIYVPLKVYGGECSSA